MISPYCCSTKFGKFLAIMTIPLWWKLMPGVTIKAKWPVGKITKWEIDHNQFLHKESADPNDHYRPWLEENVGRQGWDWDWTMIDNDVTDNVLTIKFRKGKTQFATLAAMRWS